MRYYGIFLLLLAGCRHQTSIFEDDNSTSYLVLLHNKVRCKHDLEQLQIDKDLAKKAQAHAEWMASHSTLTHSNLRSPKFRHMSENIAEGQLDEQEAIDCWMQSSGHRRNILDEDHTHVGAGYAVSANRTPYWCVIFAD